MVSIKTNAFSPFALILSFIASSYAQNKNQKFDENKLLERVEILSSDKFEGRRTGEKGKEAL